MLENCEQCPTQFPKAQVMSDLESKTPQKISLLSQRTKKNNKSSQCRSWSKEMFGRIIKMVADYFYAEHVTIID